MSEIKHIYLIRHGQTKMNRGYRHQGPDEPLTDVGREQVRGLVDFLREQKIDTLICSNYARARETADMLGKALDLTYSVEPSVREFGRPVSLYGRHHLSFISLRYFLDLYRNRLNLLWNKDGAENLAHIRERVRDARMMLEGQEGKRIAVISHRILMTMFVETVCYDKPLSMLKFIKGVIGRKRIPNTGIVHLICEPSNPKENKCSWVLVETLFPPYNS